MCVAYNRGIDTFEHRAPESTTPQLPPLVRGSAQAARPGLKHRYARQRTLHDARAWLTRHSRAQNAASGLGSRHRRGGGRRRCDASRTSTQPASFENRPHAGSLPEAPQPDNQQLRSAPGRARTPVTRFVCASMRWLLCAGTFVCKGWARRCRPGREPTVGRGWWADRQGADVLFAFLNGPRVLCAASLFAATGR